MSLLLDAAYLAGFAWGLGRGYSVLVEMDADGSHQPELLPSLLAALHDLDADMVKGSRWMRGGATVLSATSWRCVRARCR